MAHDEPRHATTPLRSPGDRRGRESRSGERPSVAPRGGDGIGRRRGGERRVEGGVEAGDVRGARQRAPRLVESRRARRMWSGASSTSSPSCRAHRRRRRRSARRTGRRRARRGGRRPSTGDGSIDSVRSTSRSRSRRRRRRCSFRLVEPALTTRTSLSAGHVQSRISGMSLAVLARVRAARRAARSTIVLAQMPRRVGETAVRGRSRRSRGGSGRGR